MLSLFQAVLWHLRRHLWNHPAGAAGEPAWVPTANLPRGASASVRVLLGDDLQLCSFEPASWHGRRSIHAQLHAGHTAAGDGHLCCSASSANQLGMLLSSLIGLRQHHHTAGGYDRPDVAGSTGSPAGRAGVPCEGSLLRSATQLPCRCAASAVGLKAAPQNKDSACSAVQCSEACVGRLGHRCCQQAEDRSSSSPPVRWLWACSRYVLPSLLTCCGMLIDSFSSLELTWNVLLLQQPVMLRAGRCIPGYLGTKRPHNTVDPPAHVVLLLQSTQVRQPLSGVLNSLQVVIT